MFTHSHLTSTLFRDQIAYLDDSDRHLFPASNPQYRFAIIGTGMIGLEHIRVTLLEGRAAIHGIYDPNERSARTAEAMMSDLQGRAATEAEPSPAAGTEANSAKPPQDKRPAPVRLYPTLEAACADPAVDAFIVCTPNHTHLEVLRAVMASRKPILLEKPMATTIPDAFRIAELARNYDSFVQIGLQYRYKAIYRECYTETVQRTSLGALKTITILEHRLPFLDKVGQWNKFAELSGGTLIEKCCHYFDLFTLFAQSRPLAVTAVGEMAVNFTQFSHRGRRSDIIDHAIVIVTYRNGVKANLNLCMFSPMFNEQIVLCGDQGRIHASESEDFMASGFRTAFEMRCANGIPARDATLRYPLPIEQSGHSGATYFEHVDFIERLRGNPTPAATVEDGLWSIVIAAAAERAIQEGRTIHIDELLQEHGVSV